MPRYCIVGRSCIALSMKIYLATAPVEAASPAISWRSAKAGGPALPQVVWDRGPKRCAPVPVRPCWPGFSALSEEAPLECTDAPGWSGNYKGRKRLCHGHVHHHWPPREV